MKKTFVFLKLAFIGLFVLGLIVDFKAVNTGIVESLKMWSMVLIPSLFPYLVISRYIVQTGIPSFFSPLKKLISKIFNISYESADVYLCSLLCGYPCGAVCTADLYKKAIIEKSEAERLICFTNNAGPLFLICAVGGSMLGSIKAGFIIYTVQCVSSFLVGVLLSKGKKVCFQKTKYKRLTVPSIADCCEASVGTILAIGGYIAFITAAGEVACFFLSKFIIHNNMLLRTVVYFVLEISKGMHLLSFLNQSIIKIPLMAACASWAGICVILQVKGVIPKEIKIKKFIFSRFIQSIISFFTVFLFCGHKTQVDGLAIEHAPIKASLIASVIIFFFYLISLKKKNKSAGFRKGAHTRKNEA